MPTPTIDLTDADIDEMDDAVCVHLPTVRAAKELKRHRATLERVEEFARMLESSGSATSRHFAACLRARLATP